MFLLGYNTNGFAHHRPVDALEVAAELGYEALAITPDVGPLDPLAPDARTVDAMRLRAEELGVVLTVETGARFVLDARRKHFPTLMEELAEDRARRADFLERSIDLAADLGAGVVSFWAGAAPGGSTGDEAAPDELWERLVEGAERVLARGAAQGVVVAFEPEPGMFIERPSGYDELVRRLGSSGERLGLCLDVGHLLVTGDVPVGEVIRSYGERLAMVHLDDIAGGVHEHRMFGTGDLDLGEVMRALFEVDYDGVAAVELSRDSHRAPWAAAKAM
ncbi:MAG: sugar phosphate isomerase/epimerase family protein [Planctomycetota bacterium]